MAIKVPVRPLYATVQPPGEFDPSQVKKPKEGQYVPKPDDIWQAEIERARNNPHKARFFCQACCHTFLLDYGTMARFPDEIYPDDFDRYCKRCFKEHHMERDTR